MLVCDARCVSCQSACVPVTSHLWFQTSGPSLLNWNSCAGNGRGNGGSFIPCGKGAGGVGGESS